MVAALVLPSLSAHVSRSNNLRSAIVKRTVSPGLAVDGATELRAGDRRDQNPHRAVAELSQFLFCTDIGLERSRSVELNARLVRITTGAHSTANSGLPRTRPGPKRATRLRRSS